MTRVDPDLASSDPVIVELRGRSLQARPIWVGADLVVPIGGGSRPHIGSVVIAQPVSGSREGGRRSPSISVLTIPPHKEEPIARVVAKRLAESLHCVVVASAGVHEDELSLDGIETYLELGELMANRLIEFLTA